MRPAASRNERDENGHEDGAPKAFVCDAALEDVRAWRHGPESSPGPAPASR